MSSFIYIYIYIVISLLLHSLFLYVVVRSDCISSVVRSLFRYGFVSSSVSLFVRSLFVSLWRLCFFSYLCVGRYVFICFVLSFFLYASIYVFISLFMPSVISLCVCTYLVRYLCMPFVLL